MSKYTHSPVLFVKIDASPMEFYMRTGKMKPLMRDLIEHGGGILRIRRGRDIIHLVEPGCRVLNLISGEKMISVRYVQDCVEQNRLLDLDSYAKQLNSLNVSDISDDNTSNFDIKVSSQSGLGEKYTQSEDLKIIDYILENKSNFVKLSKRQFFQQLQKSKILSRSQKSLCERLETIAARIDSYGLSDKKIGCLKKLIAKKKKYISYTKEDDMKILNYIMDNNEGYRVRGDKLWEKMAVNKVTDHSRKSMHGRFHNRILPHIYEYNIPVFQIKRMLKDSSDIATCAPFRDDSAGSTGKEPVASHSRTRSSDFHGCTSTLQRQFQAVPLKKNKIDIKQKSHHKIENNDKGLSLTQKKLPVFSAASKKTPISITMKQPPILAFLDQPLHPKLTMVKQEPEDLGPSPSVHMELEVPIKKSPEPPSLEVENIIVDDPSTKLPDISDAVCNYTNSNSSTPTLIFGSKPESLEFEIDSQDDHKTSTATRCETSSGGKYTGLNTLPEENAPRNIKMCMLYGSIQDNSLFLPDSLDESCNNDKNRSLPISEEKTSSNSSYVSLPAMPTDDITTEVINQCKSASPKPLEKDFSDDYSKIDSCLPSTSSASPLHQVPLDDFDTAMLDKMQASKHQDHCSSIPQINYISSTAEISGPYELHPPYVNRAENDSPEIFSDHVSSAPDSVSCMSNKVSLSTEKKKLFVDEAASLVKNIESVIVSLESGTMPTAHKQMKRKIAELNSLLYESILESEAECILKKPHLTLADKATLIKLLACREKSTPQNLLESIARNISNRS